MAFCEDRRRRRYRRAHFIWPSFTPVHSPFTSFLCYYRTIFTGKTLAQIYSYPKRFDWWMVNREKYIWQILSSHLSPIFSSHFPLHQNTFTLVFLIAAKHICAELFCSLWTCHISNPATASLIILRFATSGNRSVYMSFERWTVIGILRYEGSPFAKSKSGDSATTHVWVIKASPGILVHAWVLWMYVTANMSVHSGDSLPFVEHVAALWSHIAYWITAKMVNHRKSEKVQVQVL